MQMVGGEKGKGWRRNVGDEKDVDDDGDDEDERDDVTMMTMNKVENVYNKFCDLDYDLGNFCDFRQRVEWLSWFVTTSWMTFMILDHELNDCYDSGPRVE